MPNELSQEVWKDIPEFPGYQVSSFGRARSFRRNGGRCKIYETSRYLSLIKQGGGHYVIVLYKNATRHPRLIHRVVLEAFVGPCPEGMECCHKDDDKSNNRISNLYWGTSIDNTNDAIRNGKFKIGGKGEKHHFSRLKNLDVLDIKSRFLAKEPASSIARRYAITIGTVYDIKYGRTWSHIQLSDNADAVERMLG